MPDAPILVLVNPQDIVNIASAVRIAKNFGIPDIRLVQPAAFDPWRIEGIAHNTADLVDQIRICDTLEEAVADCVHTFALTARARTAKRTVLSPREAADGLVERLADGLVAIVAGREDSGLTNAELDRCSALVRIPTSPDYPSLNLAQAVAVMGYESWVARGSGVPRARTGARRTAPPAESGQLEWLFRDWERALVTIDFFKTRQPDLVLRSFREIVFRAGLDAREASLIRAMGIEVFRFYERQAAASGAEPSVGPGGEAGPLA